MNLSWLEDFLALAASGNFSRAAEERHMTQPAFSRRIRALEEWLGTELFDRTSQPARLTAAGEWFRQAAHEMLARAARLPGEAKAVAEAHSTTLRFAATHALSFTFMPGWLRRLEASTAVGPITLVSDVFARCEAMLLQSQVQFVLSHAHPLFASELEGQDYPFARVGTDVLVPVSAPDAQGQPRYPLAQDVPGVPLPLLSYSPESGIGRILREVRGAALERSAAQSVFQAHLASVLRTMALDGRGVAWLPETLIAEDLASRRLVEAAPPDWSIEMEIRLYRDRSSLGKAAEDFWTAVCDATT
ncbi:LysR family transcriptional regulator [Ideonella sp. YS5]|uniref:LysR family transcriptional regulator n=1 Tax=Ideonella sp. YS5 TaxID=3453714 RepID=UPI003F721CF4